MVRGVVWARAPPGERLVAGEVVDKAMAPRLGVLSLLHLLHRRHLTLPILSTFSPMLIHPLHAPLHFPPSLPLLRLRLWLRGPWTSVSLLSQGVGVLLLQVVLEPLLLVGCPGVAVDFSDGRISVGLFEGLCGAGGPFRAALARQPPPSHFQALGVTSETTPGLFFPPLLFFGLHFFVLLV